MTEDLALEAPADDKTVPPREPAGELRRPSPGFVHVAQLVGVTLIYVVAGKLGLKLAFVNASATVVWPPTGIALAALLILGSRIWPAVFVGAFVVNLFTAGSVVTSVGIAIGNTLEAVVGAHLARKFAGGRHAFQRAWDVFAFTVLAGLGSTTLSAFQGGEAPSFQPVPLPSTD